MLHTGLLHIYIYVFVCVTHVGIIVHPTTTTNARHMGQRIKKKKERFSEYGALHEEYDYNVFFLFVFCFFFLTIFLWHTKKSAPERSSTILLLLPPCAFQADCIKSNSQNAMHISCKLHHLINILLCIQHSPCVYLLLLYALAWYTSSNIVVDRAAPHTVYGSVLADSFSV